MNYKTYRRFVGLNKTDKDYLCNVILRQYDIVFVSLNNNDVFVPGEEETLNEIEQQFIAYVMSNNLISTMKITYEE